MSDTAAATPGAGEPAPTPTRSERPGAPRRGIVARVVLFVRQVVAELRKVVWPTRTELLRYTAVVLVFVAVVMAFVTLVDLGVGRLSFWVFGG